MTDHKTGTREEWLAARLELLEAEKALTRVPSSVSKRYSLSMRTQGSSWRHRASSSLRHDLTGCAATAAAYWRSSALAAPLRQFCASDSAMGSGKISSCPFSTPSKMPRATDSGEALGMSRSWDISVSTGPVRTA